MTKIKEDIPTRDDDFYTFIKDIIQVLEEPLRPGAAQPKWQAWRIPETAFNGIKENFISYERSYLKAQKKKDRSQSDVAVHRSQREKVMEPLLRQFIKEHLRFESIIPEGEKVRMALISKDTEPSPVHGSHLATLAPAVSLKNMGGAKIDVRFRRTSDQSRSSVPKGYGCELRYVLEIALPDDPEDIPSKTTVISSKARFQVDAAMPNLGKSMQGYARWRHKTNPAFNSPWAEVMKITIA